MLVTSVAVVLCFGLLLAVPVTLEFWVHPKRVHQPKCTWVWLFGLVRINCSGNRKGKNKNRTQHKTRKNNGRNRKALVFKLIRQTAFRKRLAKFLYELIKAVKRKDVQLRMRIGLDDPADTGMLWSIIGPIAGWLGSMRQMSVVIVPEFHEEMLEIDGQGNVRFIPLRLMLLVGALMFSPVVWTSVMRSRSGS